MQALREALITNDRVVSAERDGQAFLPWIVSREFVLATTWTGFWVIQLLSSNPCSIARLKKQKLLNGSDVNDTDVGSDISDRWSRCTKVVCHNYVLFCMVPASEWFPTFKLPNEYMFQATPGLQRVCASSLVTQVSVWSMYVCHCFVNLWSLVSYIPKNLCVSKTFTLLMQSHSAEHCACSYCLEWGQVPVSPHTASSAVHPARARGDQNTKLVWTQEQGHVHENMSGLQQSI